jgi:PAT family beta-lactamase induction signal transducer AmpG
MVRKKLNTLIPYLHPRVLVILVLGIASGLPLVLTMSTLSAWLTEVGVSKTTIGISALIGLSYTLKFLWAPLIDAMPLPFLTKMLGRRRSWMVLSQVALIISIWGMAHTDPGAHLYHTILWAVLVAFFSATQDVVIDSYRIELLKPEQQGEGVAMAMLGYRIGMLIAGAGTLIVAQYYSWTAAYSIMCLVIVVGMVAALLAGEPEISAAIEKKREKEHKAANMGLAALIVTSLKHTVIDPFADFMTKQGWFLLLVFVVLFKLPDAFAGAMTIPFLLELTFTKVQIAGIVKTWGALAVISGSFMGAYLLLRYNMLVCLWVALILQTLSNLAFIWQNHVGHDLRVLMAVMSIENLCTGIGSTIFVTMLSRLCVNPLYTATQFALLSALASFARTTLSAPSGWVVDHWGWDAYFLTSCFLAIPSILIMVYYKDRLAPSTVSPAKAFVEKITKTAIKAVAKRKRK